MAIEIEYLNSENVFIFPCANRLKPWIDAEIPNVPDNIYYSNATTEYNLRCQGGIVGDFNSYIISIEPIDSSLVNITANIGGYLVVLKNLPSAAKYLGIKLGPPPRSIGTPPVYDEVLVPIDDNYTTLDVPLDGTDTPIFTGLAYITSDIEDDFNDFKTVLSINGTPRILDMAADIGVVGRYMGKNQIQLN